MGMTVFTKVVLAFGVLVVAALLAFFAYRRRHPIEGPGESREPPAPGPETDGGRRPDDEGPR